MSGWGWAGMTIGFVLFWALIVAGVVYLVRGGHRQDGASRASRSPHDVLSDRLARGEISTTAYQDAMAALNGG